MMEHLELAVPTLFGLEGLAAEELRRLGLTDVRPENGRVLCGARAADIPRLNLNLRTGERVLLVLGSFPAGDFDALFEGTRALPWEDLIPRNGAFPVKGHCLNSALHAVPACQAIIKKAVAARLGGAYGLDKLPETGPLYQIQFSLMKDTAVLMLDTTGPGLHKRGYRAVGVTAPLRETLAAAMVLLSKYRGRDPFCDPFCGSGTIAADEAMDREFDGSYDIWGGDIDPKAVSIARSNAEKAGVEDLVRFEVADALRFRREAPYGRLVTNPPYGERILEKREAEELYREFGRAFRSLPDGWTLSLLSSHTEFERTFGRTADKRRKLYNGMIKCDLFLYGKRGVRYEKGKK